MIGCYSYVSEGPRCAPPTVPLPAYVDIAVSNVIAVNIVRKLRVTVP
jgi:hypothetical protein